MKKQNDKDNEIEYLKKKVAIYKNFGENMLKFNKKLLKDLIFYNKISNILYGCAFLLGVAFGLTLMGVGA